MKNMVIMAFIAGLSFAFWPVLMGKSNLSGNTASFAWALVIVACLIPVLAVTGVGEVSAVKWQFVIVSGIVGAVGILALNGAIVRTGFDAKTIGKVLTLMIGAQVVASTLYGIIASQGKVSVREVAGFLAVSVGVLLLTTGKQEA